MNDKVKVKSIINTSEGSAPYIEALYESFLKDPNSVSDDWKIYFETLPKNSDNETDISHKDVIKKFKNHLDEYHPNGSSIHEEKGHYFTVNKLFREKIKNLYEQ